MGRGLDERLAEITRAARKAHTQVRFSNLTRLHLLIKPFRWELGCRRLTPGLPYLLAVQEPNVYVERTPISRITAKGIMTTDGSLHEFDAIVCATGFNTSFSARFDIVGRHGRNLRELWTKDVPEAYMGLTVAGFPNYFGLFSLL